MHWVKRHWRRPPRPGHESCVCPCGQPAVIHWWGLVGAGTCYCLACMTRILRAQRDERTREAATRTVF